LLVRGMNQNPIVLLANRFIDRLWRRNEPDDAKQGNVTQRTTSTAAAGG
jgi:hypothetical protein